PTVLRGLARPCRRPRAHTRLRLSSEPNDRPDPSPDGGGPISPHVHCWQPGRYSATRLSGNDGALSTVVIQAIVRHRRARVRGGSDPSHLRIRLPGPRHREPRAHPHRDVAHGSRPHPTRLRRSGAVRGRPWPRDTTDHMSPRARPRVCLFTGPSLPAADMEAEFRHVDADVVVRPPIEQGDVLRLAHRLPDVIGIVDGQFFHAPAVLHREILFALERGVRILGAASIGALRAAELDSFGMEGIGEIYRRYRTGIIDSDDEVAVLHGPAADEFRPLTEALVTIRHNLGRA